MSQEIELYSRMNQPLEAIEKLGKWMAKSGMFGCDREEQGMVLATVCMAEGKSPVAISRKYHIMDGKLSQKAMSAYADFRALGGKVKWLKTGDDGKEASAEVTFEGQTVVVSYTIENAKLQGLVRPNSNWVKTPANMLRARVISNAIGMLAPEVYAGEDEDERPAPPAPALNLATETASPAAAKPVVIEVMPAPAAVETTVEVKAEKPVKVAKVAKVETAPVVTVARADGAATPTAPTKPAGKPGEWGSETLPDDIQGKLEEIIGAGSDKAVDYLRAKHGMGKEHNLSHMPLALAKRIMANPGGFKNAAGIKG